MHVAHWAGPKSHCAGQVLTASAICGMMLLIDVMKLLIIEMVHSAEFAVSVSLSAELELELERLAIAGGVICTRSRPATSAKVISCVAFMMD